MLSAEDVLCQALVLLSASFVLILSETLMFFLCKWRLRDLHKVAQRKATRFEIPMPSTFHQIMLFLIIGMEKDDLVQN